MERPGWLGAVSSFAKTRFLWINTRIFGRLKSVSLCALVHVCLFASLYKAQMIGSDSHFCASMTCQQHLHINAGEAVDTTDLMSTLEHVKIKQGGSTVRLFFVSFSSSWQAYLCNTDFSLAMMNWAGCEASHICSREVLFKSNLPDMSLNWRKWEHLFKSPKNIWE